MKRLCDGILRPKYNQSVCKADGGITYVTSVCVMDETRDKEVDRLSDGCTLLAGRSCQRTVTGGTHGCICIVDSPETRTAPSRSGASVVGSSMHQHWPVPRRCAHPFSDKAMLLRRRAMEKTI